MKTKSTFVAFTLAILGGISVSQAALVINFDPATTALNRALTTDTTTSKQISFNTTTPIFNGSATVGLKFYGGFEASAQAGTTLTGQTINISGTQLTAQASRSAGTQTVTNKFFAFYDSADFEIPGSTTLDLTAASSFSLTGNRTNAAGVSFVIRNGTQFYISQSNNTSGGFTHTSNGTTLAWTAFDPANWAGFTHGTTPAGLGVGATGSFVAQTFTNVTGVGYIIGAARANSNNPILTVSDFQVNLVPEPGAALLGSLGMLVLFGRRRSVH